MRPGPRRHLSYASLVLLLAADVLGLTALLVNQWVEGGGWIAWGIALAITALVMPMLLRLADKVFALARAARTIPVAGESFP